MGGNTYKAQVGSTLQSAKHLSEGQINTEKRAEDGEERTGSGRVRIREYKGDFFVKTRSPSQEVVGGTFPKREGYAGWVTFRQKGRGTSRCLFRSQKGKTVREMRGASLSLQQEKSKNYNAGAQPDQMIDPRTCWAHFMGGEKQTTRRGQGNMETLRGERKKGDCQRGKKGNQGRGKRPTGERSPANGHSKGKSGRGGHHPRPSGRARVTHRRCSERAVNDMKRTENLLRDSTS